MGQSLMSRLRLSLIERRVPLWLDSPVESFVEEDGRTRLELLVQAVSKEIRDAIIDSGMEGGMQEQMDALEELAISLAG